MAGHSVRLLWGQDRTSGPIQPESFVILPLNRPPCCSPVLGGADAIPCNRNWEVGVETVNPQSGRPSLCPGCPLIPKPNSRQCWARCRPNPLPTSLGLAKGPPRSHALSLEGRGQMPLSSTPGFTAPEDTLTHTKLEKGTPLQKNPPSRITTINTHLY